MAAYGARTAEIGEAAADREAVRHRPAVVAKAAALLGVSPDRATLIATTAATWAATLSRLPLRGRTVLLSAHEWGDNVRAAQWLCARHGGTVRVGPPDDAPEAWAAAIDDSVIAVSLPLVSSVGGHLAPLETITAVPRPADALVIVDAAQAYGHVPVPAADVIIGCARKWLRGPRGIGIGVLSPRAERVMGVSPQNFGPLDLDGAAVHGLSAALDAFDGRVTIPALAEKGARVRAMVRDAGLSVWCAPCGAITTLAIPHGRAEAVAAALDAAGIVTKWPDAARDEPLAPPSDGALLRLSAHLDTPDEALTQAIGLVSKAVHGSPH